MLHVYWNDFSNKETQVWASQTKKAWLNEEVMIRYLEYFSENWTHGQPCALLLDCFKAHCTKLVRQYAKKLYIELIYVPVNGTSDFQPLDRKIFGILKSKLRSLAGSKLFSGIERFEMITKDLIQSWNQITPENLSSAWNIDNLEVLIMKIAQGRNIEEVDEEFELFTDDDDDILECIF